VANTTLCSARDLLPSVTTFSSQVGDQYAEERTDRRRDQGFAIQRAAPTIVTCSHYVGSTGLKGLVSPSFPAPGGDLGAPGWTPRPDRGWRVAEVGACPSHRHRPKTSRADQAPWVKVVQSVECSTVTRGACPAPRRGGPTRTSTR
jgi:hypothetical protein